MSEPTSFTADSPKSRHSFFGCSAYIVLTVALGLMILGGTVFFYLLTENVWVILGGAFELLLLICLFIFLRPASRLQLSMEETNGHFASERTLTVQNQYYQLLHEASLGLLNRLNRQDLMQSFMHLLAEVSGIRHSFLFLLDPQIDRMVRRFGDGIHATFPVGVQSYARGEAVVGTVWETGKTLLVDDYRTWKKHDPDAAFSRFTSILAVPVKRGDDEIIGVLGLTFLDEVGVFAPEMVEFMERAAQLAAVALDNLALFESLQQSEETARAIFEQSSDAAALFDVTTRRIVEVNTQFTQMLSFSREELLGMTAYDLVVDSPNEIDWRFEKSFVEGKTGFMPEIRQLRCKDGRIVDVERSLAHISMQDKKLLLTTFRDITEAKKLQEQMKQELRNAGAVQRSLLVPDYFSERVEIRTLYQPYREVSGDFYGYRWSRSGTLLQGFLIDVMGHGVGTALQTAALNVLFNQAIDEKLSLKQTLLLVNQQAQDYFGEEMFAAALCFELDLSEMTLQYVSGGINYFLASARNLQGLIKVPGSLVGVNDDAEFIEHTVKVQPGDAFYFVTDGLMDIMMRNVPAYLHDFDRMLDTVRLVAPSGTGHDDASALCIKIKDNSTWPVIFEISQPEEVRFLRGRLRDLLSRAAGGKSVFIEVMMNEAINNAVRSAKSSENPVIRIKINRMGSRLIFRIRDTGGGFDRSGVIADMKCDWPEEKQKDVCPEDGRGLPIMWSLADRMIFNARGNEVLIMKKV